MPVNDGVTDCGDVVGRCFLDKLLLAIIDAHPVPASSAVVAVRQREERLRRAREVLLGQSNQEGRPPESDEVILRWIGNEHHNDRARQNLAELMGQPRPKVRSERKLVEKAVEHFHLPANASERLRKKLRPHGLQKWLEVATYHDDVPEQLDMNLLEAVREILAKRGIAMDLKNAEQ
ncbi:hypothetical protein GOE20_11515 [Sinorhizobium medicae]|nr:hypothetical protein [Sinorhizobium medicae]